MFSTASSLNSELPNVNFPTSFRMQLVDKWKDVIANEASGGSHVLDMPMWIGKATLDA